MTKGEMLRERSAGPGRRKKIKPTQPEIITCTECKYYDTDTEQCNNDKGLRFIDFGNPERMWCSWAERLEE